MHRSITAAAAVVMAGLLATVVLAGTVNGTAKNDKLRGSPKADAINGKAGNDKLYGLAGNDKLIGGAGNDLLDGGPQADLLNCGPGKDTAKADDSDTVSLTCEQVTGITPPSVSIADATVAEGNSGSATLAFSVSLSKASKRPTSVQYATADGSATVPADYASASGTLTFAPGERSKTIEVAVSGDAAIEADETLALALSAPVNAQIGDATAVGTIKNDDTAVPVAAGQYKGTLPDGEFVFLTVTPDRKVTGFRANKISVGCSYGLRLVGGIDWTDGVFPIRDDASFAGRRDWESEPREGGVEWVKAHEEVDGTFSGNSVSGTLLIRYELKYNGAIYQCSTRPSPVRVAWSATLQG